MTFFFNDSTAGHVDRFSSVCFLTTQGLRKLYEIERIMHEFHTNSLQIAGGEEIRILRRRCYNVMCAVQHAREGIVDVG